MDWAHATNGQQFPSMSCTDMDTGRLMQEKKTQRNMAWVDGRKRVNGINKLLILSKGRICGGWQSVLEGYNFWSYTPCPIFIFFLIEKCN